MICVVLCVVPLLTAQQAPPNDRVLNMMREYTEAPGPSGFEETVREIFIRDLRALGAEISIDGMGSVIGVVHGSADAPRVMLDAHLDEVGLMVQHIRPDGFISFQPLGGVMDQEYIDQRWVIMTEQGPVQAVTGIVDAHILPSNMRDKVSPREAIFLDVGAKSKASAEALGIRPGDPVAPLFPLTVLADHRIAAKAWDDRVGLMVMLEAVRKLKARGASLPCSVYLVATTQEEIWLRGAHTAVQMVKPDLGIGIEVGIAGDVPGAAPEIAQERLGDGPALFLYESSMIPNTRLRNFFLRVATEEKIPIQTEVLSGSYGQDAREIQAFAEGKPAVNLTVPTRYTHAHAGVIDRDDFDHTVDLLVAVLKRLDAKTVRQIASFQ
jgi:endoglucanase